jgi:uncharacterized protein YceH (UPF0502 family)
MPGRKDSEYMHLFSGPVDVEAYAVKSAAEKTTEHASKSSLEQRVAALEAEVAELRSMLSH